MALVPLVASPCRLTLRDFFDAKSEHRTSMIKFANQVRTAETGVDSWHTARLFPALAHRRTLLPFSCSVQITYWVVESIVEFKSLADRCNALLKCIRMAQYLKVRLCAMTGARYRASLLGGAVVCFSGMSSSSPSISFLPQSDRLRDFHGFMAVMTGLQLSHVCHGIPLRPLYVVIPARSHCFVSLHICRSRASKRRGRPPKESSRGWWQPFERTWCLWQTLETACTATSWSMSPRAPLPPLLCPF